MVRRILEEARHVAHSLMVPVNGAEVMSATPGESEARLRGVFRRAREFVDASPASVPAVAVVFLDEVDAFLRDRSQDSAPAMG